MLSLIKTGMEPVHSDAELVALCQKGAVSAYEKLYQAHGSRMKSIAYNILGNRMDAEDAVQETFLKVYRSIHSFQGQASFSTWVYRILVNTCTDVQRSRKQRMEELPDSLTGRETSVPSRIALERALAKLNPKHRMVFLLAEAEGFKHTEIAGILGIPEGTSKGWLFEAKRMLQKALSR